MKTQKRPHVILSKLDRVSDEVWSSWKGVINLEASQVLDSLQFDLNINHRHFLSYCGVFTQPGPKAVAQDNFLITCILIPPASGTGYMTSIAAQRYPVVKLL